jgi:hypothetical protein
MIYLYSTVIAPLDEEIAIGWLWNAKLRYNESPDEGESVTATH